MTNSKLSDCRELGSVWQLCNLWWCFRSAYFDSYFTNIIVLGLVVEEAVLPLSNALSCCTAFWRIGTSWYWNSKFWYYQFSNTCWTLSWASSIHFSFHHRVFLILTVILLSSCLPTRYFLRDFPTKLLDSFPFSTLLSLSIILAFHYPNNTGDLYRSYSFLLCNIYPSYIPSLS